MRLSPSLSEPPLIVLLTAGRFNETYFEHAYLARYLGIPLVEGSDLTVRGDELFLKTLTGLTPVQVVLRRLDDNYCDPLELRSDSTLGVPGLLQAVRAGKVLYGDAGVVSTVPNSGACDSLDVCGAQKSVCLTAEVGKSLSALQTSVGSIYPAFFCGTPMNEPSCVPQRGADLRYNLTITLEEAFAAHRALLAARVRELGLSISERYQGQSLVLVAVLKGSFVFVADLARAKQLATKAAA